MCRGRAAVGGHGRFRRGFYAAAILLLTAAFGGEAAAQCGGGGRFNNNNNTCTVDEATGNSHLAGQATLLDVGSRFMQRFNALYTFRTGASAANNPQGGGADASDASTEQRYRTWLEGYGLRSHTDAQSSFPGDRRRTLGAVAGAGVRLAPGITAGLSVDQSETKVDITGATQNGRIGLTQVGAIASFENGPWNLGTTLIHGFGGVHTSRFDVGGQSNANYHATLWGAMAELSYYWSLPDNSRLVPKLAFDWMRTRTDPFTEIGGALPITAASVSATRMRMLIGGELGHSWLVDRTIMDVSVYGRLVDNLTQNFGTLQIIDSTGTVLPTVANAVRESELGADAGAALSAKVTDALRLYAIYDGRYRSNFTAHSATIGAELRF